MHSSILRTLMAVSFAVVGVSDAPARSSPSRLVIRTHGSVGAVALAGSRLAYYEERAFPPRCSRIVFVDVSTRKRVVVSGGEKAITCDSESASLAVAGHESAWIVGSDSNTEQWRFLEAASLPHPREHRLATSVLNAGYEIPISGSRLENLVGAGNLLVVGRWWQNDKAEATRSVVYSIGPSGVRRILAGRQAIWPQAVDRGRIAVLHGSALEHRSTRLEVYDRHGALQVAIRLGPLGYAFRGDAIALQGRQLLVLTPKRLQIYDSHSGRFVGSWPVPRHAANLDVYGGTAVYAEYSRNPGTIGGPYKLHVLDLTTGKDVVLDRGEVQAARNLELDSSGLVYVRGQRTIVFVPLKSVRAAVS